MRLARMLATPAGVLVILPALVLGVGVVVLLLGRGATHDSTEAMARHQLAAQASDVQHDITFALDQSGPVLSSLKLLAEPALATPDAVARMRDVVVGRPGIAYTSIIFPSGASYTTFVDKEQHDLRVAAAQYANDLESITNYEFGSGEARPASTSTEHYDPRTRPKYLTAVTAGKRVWLPPRTFSTSHRTGLTVAEPVFADDHSLTAVLTIDFDVSELSAFIGRAPLAGARTVMFTENGSVLAYPSAPIPTAAKDENRILSYKDFHDPALDALFASLGPHPGNDLQFLHVGADDGDYLASVATVGGAQKWFLATLVPEKTLFGATWKFGRDTIIASVGAVAIAIGVALMFAWNLVRMRREVGEARAEAKSAAERAKQLGSYKLVEKLGGGGMGEVWRAQHQLLAREAAIKLVRPEALRDAAHRPVVQERFRREAQTLASLRSRHTIALYDYGVTADGSFFYVMELLDGLDLAQLVMKHGPQPAARVISIIAQACQSLAEAHEAGLFHRDIKPANLFLSRAADEVDIVKLLDFGIVHNMADPIEPVREKEPSAAPSSGTGTSTGERLTKVGTVIGTPGYIAPEQATGAPPDARGDLYALGCVAWWLLTGGDVFPRKTEDEVVLAHVSDIVPDLADKVRGWLPKALELLVYQCLEKKPADRPQTARALADALHAIDVPGEHAWVRAQATAWWAASLGGTATAAPEAATAAAGMPVVPAGRSEAPTVQTDRRLVPQRAETEKSEKPAAARTIEARPTSRGQ